MPKLPKTKKFAISLRDNENVPQVDTMILMEMVKHFQSSQNSKFTISVQYLKKDVRDRVDLLLVNIKVAYKLISILYAPMSATK